MGRSLCLFICVDIVFDDTFFLLSDLLNTVDFVIMTLLTRFLHRDLSVTFYIHILRFCPLVLFPSSSL